MLLLLLPDRAKVLLLHMHLRLLVLGVDLELLKLLSSQKRLLHMATTLVTL
jgi:hypothetical protein